MSREVTVDLGERSYPICIGPGLLKDLGVKCADRSAGSVCLIVSDSNVDPLYGDACEASLSEAGVTAKRVVIPAGESSKSESEIFKLYDEALEVPLDRKSFIVALGGGVVGDIAGYAAASYLRGITLVQVPTSLLAMVDSAVGGKTGINLPQGKNLIGAFHQPALVLVDSDTLATLPRREFVAGMAEVVKYGIIWDAELFALLEANMGKLIEERGGLLDQVIARCCEIKAEVVRQDEREGGLRAILNFGHTLGHALEQVSGYGKFLHGEAIAVGMVFAAELSVRHHGLDAGDAARIRRLLQSCDLPVSVSDYSWEELRSAMTLDKKTVGKALRFVLAGAIGKVDTGCEISDGVLKEVWNVCCQ
ncbi:MAG: 3-dehydroquinate synthase [Verrucomicrobia bacterium]|nr:3-dehydroquinate synthase [Verrucomicrobiota bacterium]